MNRNKNNQLPLHSDWKARSKARVGVLGAGAGGTATALELAKRGFLVDLFDKNGEILLGSSNATPGRAGHGFHYFHSETGILYLDATLEILKEFPGCLLGAGEREDHFLRHGLYFIMKEENDLDEKDKQFSSLFPAQQILNTYEKLRLAYQKKIEKDPELRFFGDPEKFYTIRNLSDFSDIVDTSKIAVAVDTREELLNWPMVRSRLCQQVNVHPNITVHTRALVKKTHYDADTHGFIIETSKGKFKVDYVVNSSWESVGYLSHRMSFNTHSEVITMRLKGIVKVALPDSLKKRSSMFFCMGAHCMFSNMGDGTGMITYAPITNITSSTSLKISVEMQSFLDGEATHEQKMVFAQKILKGVSHYIPAMLNATVIDVGFGIIKTIGDVDIFDPDSRFHHRDYLGVKSQQIGWIDNSCMKLLYFLRNSRLTASMLEQHVEANISILKIKEHLSCQAKLVGRKDFGEMIVVNLQRNFDSAVISAEHENIVNSIESVVRSKALLNDELMQLTLCQTWKGATCYWLSRSLQMWSEAPGSVKLMTFLGAAIASFVSVKFFLDRDITCLPVSFWSSGERLGRLNDSFFFSAKQSSCRFGHV